MLFKTKKDIVGIDIGSSAVKFVLLREAKGQYHLVSLGMAPLPPEAIVDNAIMDSTAIVEAVRSLVVSHKLKTKNVAASISGHSVIIRKIQLPIMTDEELESSIHWEAEQYIPFEISEVNLDFQILGTDPKDPSLMSVILVASKKDFVNDYLSVFKECGLTPLVMDIDCFALENAFEINHGFGEEEVVALINMGASSMNINVLKEGHSLFTRDIQVGGNIINEGIQKRLGLDSETSERVKQGLLVDGIDQKAVSDVLAEATETLAQEVQRSLDFFSATSADEKVHKVFISGGLALMPQVKVSLSQRLGMSVEILNPFLAVGVDEKEFDLDYISSVGPLYTVATGLAMRRLGDK